MPTFMPYETHSNSSKVTLVQRHYCLYPPSKTGPRLNPQHLGDCAPGMDECLIPEDLHCPTLSPSDPCSQGSGILEAGSRQ